MKVKIKSKRPRKKSEKSVNKSVTNSFTRGNSIDLRDGLSHFELQVAQISDKAPLSTEIKQRVLDKVLKAQRMSQATLGGMSSKGQNGISSGKKQRMSIIPNRSMQTIALYTRDYGSIINKKHKTIESNQNISNILN